MSCLETIISGRGRIKRYGDGDRPVFIKEVAERILCVDGASLSVQGSAFHYCTPRTNHGPYTHVEIGYPSESPVRSWARFYDGAWTPENACDSVYGYVPVELVREFVEAHGGEA